MKSVVPAHLIVTYASGRGETIPCTSRDAAQKLAAKYKKMETVIDLEIREMKR